MRPLARAAQAAVFAAALAAGSFVPAHAAVVPAIHEPVVSERPGPSVPWADASATTRAAGLRVATYNVSLNRGAAGDLVSDLASPNNAQAQAVAEVIQRTAPDVVLLNEFDYDEGHEAADLFRSNYLAAGQNGQDGIDYPYVYAAPSNTGVPIGADLDKDGTVGGAADSFGFGDFAGQYGMVLYSKHPLVEEEIRTFRTFRWKDMPGNMMPRDYYGPLVSNVLRLSSKSHWDVPVRVGGETVHVLASHPTPPVFDGPERRNMRRNHDEIRFWADYISGGQSASYIYDDDGARGGLRPDERFVVLGDLNADPGRGESHPAAISQLLSSPRVTDPRPASTGAAGHLPAGFGSFVDPLSPPAPADRTGAAARLRTADFRGRGTGPLRVDYVLPSRNLTVSGSGVFWPAEGEDGADLVAGDPPRTSDHRLVWVDVELPSAGGGH
ncbi:MAG: endonuclease/exonuclease/phosphatase family protein [Arthrobacter sp.]|uniref:endonuclease/exonuclease/phosphatase family protein n=1 Tax=Arthrobacter sp. TaxID=1667 RepID=UPI0034877211